MSVQLANFPVQTGSLNPIAGVLSMPPAPEIPAPTPPAKQTKKRSKPAPKNDHSDEAESGSKKRPRGRPRVEPKDETAIERRRTQIRLAQRAYRDRKDHAVGALEQQVKELQTANQTIASEFSDLLEFLENNGFSRTNVELAYRVDDARRKLSNLSDSSKDNSDVSASNSPPSTTQNRLSPVSDGPQSSHSSATTVDDTPAMQYLMNKSATPPRDGLGIDTGNMPFQRSPETTPPTYEIITKPTADNASFPSYSDPEAVSDWPVQQVEPSPFLYHGLRSPASFAASESTFGRRLHRTSLQAGIVLATMPDPHLDRYASVFGFCLLFESRERIIKRLYRTLKSSGHESLHDWTFPFHHLGGAGLYYTNDPKSGRNILADSIAKVVNSDDEDGSDNGPANYAVGPFDSQLEALKDVRIDKRMRIMYPGFEGDFLDADEVEIYLQKRGVRIPPNSDFVEVEVKPEDFAGSVDNVEGSPGAATRVTEVSGDSEYTGDSSPTWPGSATTGVSESSVSTQQTSDLATMGSSTQMFAFGGPSLCQPEMNAVNPFLCPAIPVQWWTPGGKIRATINVDVFLNELVDRSVCLGRTPGVRVKDINASFKLASGMDFPA